MKNPLHLTISYIFESVNFWIRIYLHHNIYKGGAICNPEVCTILFKTLSQDTNIYCVNINIQLPDS